MPPTHADEGLRSAIELRRRYPRLPVPVFSKYIETRYNVQLSGGAMKVMTSSDLRANAALLIRGDAVRRYGQPGLPQTLVVIVIMFGGLAMTRAGRPVESGGRAPMSAWSLALVGAVGMFSIDILPATWVGVVVMAPLLVVVATLVRWWNKAAGWSPRQLGALVAGALVGRTLVGFLAPLPDGVIPAAKLGQNALLFTAVLGLARLLTRSRRLSPRDDQLAAPTAEPETDAPSQTS